MSNKPKLSIEPSSLAELLRGFLMLPNDSKSGLVILIEGKPGTGKSTLAIQLLDSVDPDNPRRKRRLFSIEQSEKDVTSKYMKMMAAKLVSLAPKKTKGGEDDLSPAWSNELKKFIGNRRPSGNRGRPSTQALRKKLTDLTLSSKSGPMSGDKEFAELVQATARLLSKRLSIEPRDKRSEDSFLRERSRIEESLTAIVDELRRQPSPREERPLVVVDGLSLFLPTERAAINFQSLVDVLRRTCAVGIMVYEPGTRDQGFLEHQVDLMIELHERWMEKPQTYLLHELCVRKSRYQDAALGHHQYKIRDYGLEVFPSVHFQVHQPNYMALEYARSLLKVPPSKNGQGSAVRLPESPADHRKSIIDSICQIQPGDSTVLLGPRGSFKTELCLDFLCRGSWGHCIAKSPRSLEMGLLVSMIGNSHQTHGGLCCPFNDHHSRPALCKRRNGKGVCLAALPEHIYRFHQRPGFITPAEFLSLIKQRVLKKVQGDGKSIGRFVLWDLTQLDYRFPLFAQDTMLLTALIDFFKTHKVKSLFMGAGKGRHSDAASAMADNVLFCWRTRVRQPFGAKVVHRGPYQSEPCMLIYIDRIGDESAEPAKRLYAIPVDKGHRLRISDTDSGVKPLDEGEYAKYLETDDIDKIRLITNKQGFETARLS